MKIAELIWLLLSTIGPFIVGYIVGALEERANLRQDQARSAFKMPGE